MVNQKTIKDQILSKKVYSTNGLVKVGLLSAVAFILMLLEFPLPLFPPFLKMDISDLPALLGGFALGPVAAVIIEFLKNIFHFIFKPDGTGGSGNLANFLVGISFTVPAAIIYAKNRTKKGALMGMVAGTILMVVISSLANYYILIPLFAKLFSMEKVMALMTQGNKNIVDIKSYVVYGVVPFNLIRAIVTSLIAFLVYKPLSPMLHR